MSLTLYLQCFVIALLGGLLQTSFKMRSLQIKAKLANLEFSIKQYLKDDWIVIGGNLITIFLCLFFVDEILNIKPEAIDYLKLGFAFVGYTGSDILNRVFSVANKKLNSAIDYKTTIADEATGNTDKPTPTK
jgi:hypothetical protein